MLVTELKPEKEIVKFLEKEKKVFLIGCNGCAEACETGGEKGINKIKEILAKGGKSYFQGPLIDFLCNKLLIKMRLIPYTKQLEECSSILVLGCGVGIQAVAEICEKMVFPACNTIYLDGFQGLWPAQERCLECGNCVLDISGGICPIVTCSKSLLNGSCGGAHEGKCEVDKEKDCGWDRIYKRLEKIGRLNLLEEYRPPRDYSKLISSPNRRKSIFYDLEQ